MKNKKRSKNKKREKGSILVVLTLSLAFLVGMMALSVDVGMAFLILRDLKKIAQLASLATARKLAETTQNPNDTELYNVAKEVAAANTITGQAMKPVITPSDVTPGIYNYDDGSFTAMASAADDGVNAIRVVVRQADDANNPITFKLASGMDEAFGDQIFMAARGFAIIGKLQIIFVLDNSASMDNNTYVPDPAKCLTGAVTIMDIGVRNFRENPDTGPNECLFGLPQYIYDIFATTKNDLLENDVFGTYTTSGLIVFGTTADTIVPMDGNDNKTLIQSKLAQSMSDAEQWRALKDPESDFIDSIEIFMGGGKDPSGWRSGESSGYTNVGAALHAAGVEFSKVGMENYATREVFLIGDGVANCKQLDGGCGTDAQSIIDGQKYSAKEADKLAAVDVLVHTALFDPENNCNSSSDPYKNLADIANRTGGKFVCKKNVSELQDWFKKMTLLKPIVIVEPTSES